LNICLKSLIYDIHTGLQNCISAILYLPKLFIYLAIATLS
jgi:hypothetical protein